MGLRGERGIGKLSVLTVYVESVLVYSIIMNTVNSVFSLLQVTVENFLRVLTGKTPHTVLLLVINR